MQNDVSNARERGCATWRRSGVFMLCLRASKGGGYRLGGKGDQGELEHQHARAPGLHRATHPAKVCRFVETPCHATNPGRQGDVTHRQNRTCDRPISSMDLFIRQQCANPVRRLASRRLRDGQHRECRLRAMTSCRETRGGIARCADVTSKRNCCKRYLPLGPVELRGICSQERYTENPAWTIHSRVHVHLHE